MPAAFNGGDGIVVRLFVMRSAVGPAPDPFRHFQVPALADSAPLNLATVSSSCTGHDLEARSGGQSRWILLTMDPPYDGSAMRVILSRPFVGALHWWLAVQSGVGGFQASKRSTHPYYRALYGDVDRNLDVALAACVIFEDVLVAAMDAPYPGFARADGQDLRLPELEIAAAWDPVFEAGEIAQKISSELVVVSALQTTLAASASKEERDLELQYAIADILLADRHRAPVLCAPERRILILRLLEGGFVPVSNDWRDPLRSVRSR